MPRLSLVAVVLPSAVIVMHYPRPEMSFAASEQARVRAHLDSAERSSVNPVSFAPWVSSGGAAGLRGRITF
jgi:hypothetical protein